jgi:hypothetical protein
MIFTTTPTQGRCGPWSAGERVQVMLTPTAVLFGVVEIVLASRVLVRETTGRSRWYDRCQVAPFT